MKSGFNCRSLYSYLLNTDLHTLFSDTHRVMEPVHGAQVGHSKFRFLFTTRSMLSMVNSSGKSQHLRSVNDSNVLIIYHAIISHRSSSFFRTVADFSFVGVDSARCAHSTKENADLTQHHVAAVPFVDVMRCWRSAASIHVASIGLFQLDAAGRFV